MKKALFALTALAAALSAPAHAQWYNGWDADPACRTIKLSSGTLLKQAGTGDVVNHNVFDRDCGDEKAEKSNVAWQEPARPAPYTYQAPAFTPPAEIQPTQREVERPAPMLTIPGVAFDFNKAAIDATYSAKLDGFVGDVKEGTMKFNIVGHTDDVGGDAYNQKLSEKRAKAVYDYLVKNGMDKARLSHKGMGEKDPVGDNKTEEGRAKNRRVEILKAE